MQMLPAANANAAFASSANAIGKGGMAACLSILWPCPPKLLQPLPKQIEPKIGSKPQHTLFIVFRTESAVDSALLHLITPSRCTARQVNTHTPIAAAPPRRLQGRACIHTYTYTVMMSSVCSACIVCVCVCGHPCVHCVHVRVPSPTPPTPFLRHASPPPPCTRAALTIPHHSSRFTSKTLQIPL